MIKPRKHLAAICVVLLLLAVLCGTVWERYIQIIYPAFDGTLFISGLIFIFGMSYSLIGRHLFAGLLTIASIIALPYAKVWFSVYWPWAMNTVPILKFMKSILM